MKTAEKVKAELAELEARRAELLKPESELAALQSQIAAKQAALAEEAARQEAEQAEATRQASIAAALEALAKPTRKVVDLAAALADALVELAARERELRRLGAGGPALPFGKLPAELNTRLRAWRETRPELFGLPGKPSARERATAEVKSKMDLLKRDIAEMESQGERGLSDERWLERVATAKAALKSLRQQLATSEVTQ